MAEEHSKNRKSEPQEIFEQANNAGRFAGNDKDAQAAREQAMENISEDSGSSKEERSPGENTDAEARRDTAQNKDYKAESQNMNDDTGGPLSNEEVENARNKATEGQKQGRS